MTNPSRLVSATCPKPARAETANVLPRLQPRARETNTKGNQCVGIAAWKNATVKPVAAIVLSTAEFIDEGQGKVATRDLSTSNHSRVVKGGY